MNARLGAIFASLCLQLGAAGAVAGEPLRVSAAISLRPALAEAARVYEQRTGTTVRLNTGASGVLVQQTLRGAPVDLLVSASPDEIDRLVHAALAEPTDRRSIASNRLVVVVPRGASPPGALDRLADPAIDRIAVGNPRTAPVGRYAAQALESLELLDRVREKLVFAENARHVLDYVARGEVAAGLVYRTDAGLMRERIAVDLEVPPTAHEPIVYQGIVLSESRDRAASLAWLEWLASEDGSAVLRRHGFLPPS